MHLRVSLAIALSRGERKLAMRVSTCDNAFSTIASIRTHVFGFDVFPGVPFDALVVVAAGISIQSDTFVAPSTGIVRKASTSSRGAALSPVRTSR